MPKKVPRPNRSCTVNFVNVIVPAPIRTEDIPLPKGKAPTIFGIKFSTPSAMPVAEHTCFDLGEVLTNRKKLEASKVSMMSTPKFGESVVPKHDPSFPRQITDNKIPNSLESQSSASNQSSILSSTHPHESSTFGYNTTSEHAAIIQQSAEEFHNMMNTTEDYPRSPERVKSRVLLEAEAEKNRKELRKMAKFKANEEARMKHVEQQKAIKRVAEENVKLVNHGMAELEERIKQKANKTNLFHERSGHEHQNEMHEETLRSWEKPLEKQKIIVEQYMPDPRLNRESNERVKAQPVSRELQKPAISNLMDITVKQSSGHGNGNFPKQQNLNEVPKNWMKNDNHYPINSQDVLQKQDFSYEKSITEHRNIYRQMSTEKEPERSYQHKQSTTAFSALPSKELAVHEKWKESIAKKNSFYSSGKKDIDGSNRNTDKKKETETPASKHHEYSNRFELKKKLQDCTKPIAASEMAAIRENTRREAIENVRRRRSLSIVAAPVQAPPVRPVKPNIAPYKGDIVPRTPEYSDEEDDSDESNESTDEESIDERLSPARNDKERYQQYRKNRYSEERMEIEKNGAHNRDSVYNRDRTTQKTHSSTPVQQKMGAFSRKRNYENDREESMAPKKSKHENQDVQHQKSPTQMIRSAANIRSDKPSDVGKQHGIQNKIQKAVVESSLSNYTIPKKGSSTDEKKNEEHMKMVGLMGNAIHKFANDIGDVKKRDKKMEVMKKHMGRMLRELQQIDEESTKQRKKTASRDTTDVIGKIFNDIKKQ